MAKLIVIEGAIDGIGKTTQFNKLKERLEKENKKVISHHFPSYNTKQGALVESYLKGEFGHPKDLSPYFVNSLYAIDRAVTQKNELNKETDIILLDRYTTSSMIYQSSLIEDENEKISFLDYITDFEYNKLGIKKPDHVIFLSAPFEEVKKLREERNKNDGMLVEGDIHETDQDFMKKTYDNAVFVAKRYNWQIINCMKEGAFRNKEDINNEIYNIIK